MFMAAWDKKNMAYFLYIVTSRKVRLVYILADYT